MLRGIAVPRWLGWAALIAGTAFVITAIPVGYRGFQATPAALVAVALLAMTAIGLIVAGIRTPKVRPVNEDPAKDDVAPAASPSRTAANDHGLRCCGPLHRARHRRCGVHRDRL